MFLGNFPPVLEFCSGIFGLAVFPTDTSRQLPAERMAKPGFGCAKNILNVGVCRSQGGFSDSGHGCDLGRGVCMRAVPCVESEMLLRSC